MLPLQSEGCHVGKPTIETLSFQYTEFDLCHIESAAMPGRVMDVQSFCKTPGLLRGEGFVERGDIMCIQIIHNQTSPEWHRDTVRQASV